MSSGALVVLACLSGCDRARIVVGRNASGGSGMSAVGPISNLGGGGGGRASGTGGGAGMAAAILPSSAGGSVGGPTPLGGSPAFGTAGGTAGGAGYGGGGAVAAAPDVEACDQLATTLCTSGVSCIAGTNEVACESQLRLEFGCAQAVGGIDFSTCNRDAQSNNCPSAVSGGGLQAPDSCLNPINEISLTDAQSKCYVFVDLLCAHSLQCGGRAAIATDVQNCEDDVTTNLVAGIPCLLATAVGAGYYPCIAAISTLPCADSGAGGAGGPGVGGPSGGMSTIAIPSCTAALTFSP